MAILTHLAWQAWRGGGEWVIWVGRRCWPHGWSLCWPDAGDPALLQRSLFVDPPDDDARLWSIDLALRCPAVVAVVADGSGLNMAASRRLQLAAAAGRATRRAQSSSASAAGGGQGEGAVGVLGLLARPPWEQRELSAAHSRWLVQRRPSPSRSDKAGLPGISGTPRIGPSGGEAGGGGGGVMRWSVQLLRCKGVWPDRQAPTVWGLEVDRETGAVVVSSALVDRPGTPASAAGDASNHASGDALGRASADNRRTA